MRRLLNCLLGFALLIGVGAASFAGGKSEGAGAAEPVETILITFADHNAIGSILNQNAELFKETLEAESNGRVEVRYYPASQLGNERENIEAVKLGTVEMCYADPPYLSNLVPDFSVLGLPYIFEDFAHVEAAMDGKVGDALEKKLLEKEGLRILGWYHVGFRDMMTIDKPINSLADFKGVKFRSPEVPVFVKMFRALGATPTPIPWGEVYTAMKTNLVDGMETTPEAMVSVKLYEVAHYVIHTNHMNTAMTIIVNDDFYQSLPQDIKDAIDRTIAKTTDWQRQKMIEASENAFDILRGKGMEIINIDTKPLQDAVKPEWPELTGDAEDADELIEMILEIQ